MILLWLLLGSMFHWFPSEWNVHPTTYTTTTATTATTTNRLGLDASYSHAIANATQVTTTKSTTTTTRTCNDDFYDSKHILDHIQVSSSSSSFSSTDPKILCFLLTHSGHHDTRLRDVLETWGPHCDKLLLFSNRTDATIGTIAIGEKEMKEVENDEMTTTRSTRTTRTKMSSSKQSSKVSSWKYLWKKLQLAIDILWKDYRDDYDWFLKVDDDTYVIMENLKQFLRSHHEASTMMKKTKDTTTTSSSIPRIYGRVLGISWNKLKHDLGRINHPLLQRLQERYHIPVDKFIFFFPSGGAGYVMNRSYLEVLHRGIHPSTSSSSSSSTQHDAETTTTTTTPTPTTTTTTTTTTNSSSNNGSSSSRQDRMQLFVLQGTPPEDVAQAWTVFAQNPHWVVSSTRDDRGRQQFHMLAPHEMFRLPQQKLWISRVHAFTGGIEGGWNCCSTNTITFHQMSRIPGYMHYVHDQLYTCRS